MCFDLKYIYPRSDQPGNNKHPVAFRFGFLNNYFARREIVPLEKWLFQGEGLILLRAAFHTREHSSKQRLQVKRT